MNRLNYIMTRLGMKNVKLGEAVGKTAGTIGSYRLGETKPDIDVAMKIADFLNIEVTSLLDEVDENGQLVTEEIVNEQ